MGYFVQVFNLQNDYTEGVKEQGAKENIWTEGGVRNGRLEKKCVMRNYL